MQHRRFVIAAGGTGGHIIPGILIGRELEKRYGNLLFVDYFCGSRAIEKRVYQSEGIKPTTLSLGALSAYRLPGGYYLGMGKEYFSVLGKFIFHRPTAVLAMGGAVCFPILAAAITLRIPVYLHESNRISGRVVRLFRRFARKVFLGFEGEEFPNVMATGTPSRPIPRSEKERNLVLCVGGSQGAEVLNQMFLQAANELAEKHSNLRFRLITGPGKQLEDTGRVESCEYEADIPSVLAHTRMIVSRSGSGSLADIASARIPSILVPYPHAMNNHQLANAKCFEEKDAAVVMEENGLTAQLLAQAMTELLTDGEKVTRMQKNLESLSSENAARVIAEEIVRPLLSVRDTRRSPKGEVRHDVV